mmetsp:Transcript_5175/g.8507  ORF Transcript_5175/g.8507 Transcript_5175/m.8507 type:complete len:309 (-) Transcript_5175:102-1028(-)
MENEYEGLRESNIQRNKQFLKEIGLEESVLRNNIAISKQSKGKTKRKRKLSISEMDVTINSRRSLRLAVLPPTSYKEDAVPTTGSRRSIQPVDDEYEAEEGASNQSWGPRAVPKPKPLSEVIIDPSKSSGCSMQLNTFYQQLGEELEIFGKAHVMTVANGGQLPRFSKYSGVAPWADGYFLWINIDIDPKTGKSKNEYPNKFLDDGERMTWFGGSTMHPESPAVLGLLEAGKIQPEGNGESKNKSGHNQSVVVFVREVKMPYCCFGRVVLDSVDLTKRPVRMTWRFLDFAQLKECKNFQRIVALTHVE